MCSTLAVYCCLLPEPSCVLLRYAVLNNNNNSNNNNSNNIIMIKLQAFQLIVGQVPTRCV